MKRATKESDANVGRPSWEYNYLCFPDGMFLDLTRKMNELGEDGWELVCMYWVEETKQVVSFFKRFKYDKSHLDGEQHETNH